MRTDSALLGAAIVSVAYAVPTEAIAQPRREIDIPRDNLRSALIKVGRQAKTSIGISDRSLGSLKVGPLKGRFTVDEALERLLRNTDADFRYLGDNSWRIVRKARRQTRPRTAVPPVRRGREGQAPDEESIEEIIVTGSKRRVPLRDYPGSVDLLRASDFTSADSAKGTEAISARLPSLSSTHFGSGRNKLFIRGIADSSFNGPTQATVGQYFGETRLNYNTPDPDLRLYDLQSVEILKGPQGTLYGAGSVGGILRLVPGQPDLMRTQATASALISTTAHGSPGYDVSGTLNAPLMAGRLGVRIVAYSGSAGGYIDDTLRDLKDVNRTNIMGGRAALRWEPADDWTVDLGAVGQKTKGEDSQFADRDAPPLTRESEVAQAFNNDFALGTLTIRKEWGGLSFVSATGLVRQLLDETYDATLSPEPPMLFRQKNRISTLSFENRLSKGFGESFSWILGTSFIRNRSTIDRRMEAARRTPRMLTGVENGIDEATAFAEASQALPGAVTLSAGGRLTHSRLRGMAIDSPPEVLLQNRAVRASRSETRFLPSAAVSYRPAEGLTIFARYQQGFRPGGLALRGNFVERFRNDNVTSLEAGFRFGEEHDALQLAASAAYTRWKHIQADTVDGSGLPATANIGNGRVYTLDARLAYRPAPGLVFELAGVFNDSRVTDPAPNLIIVGPSPLPNVAAANGQWSVEYVKPIGDNLELSASAWGKYVGKSRLGIGPILGDLQGDYLDTGLGARIGKGRLGFSVDATNLLDTVGNRFSLGSPFTIVDGRQVTPLRPRTIRAGFDLSF